jgi:hypothetical protein
MKKFIVEYVEDLGQPNIDVIFLKAEKARHLFDIMGAYWIQDIKEVETFWPGEKNNV